MELNDLVAFVSGGSGGLGSVITKALAASGVEYSDSVFGSPGVDP